MNIKQHISPSSQKNEKRLALVLIKEPGLSNNIYAQGLRIFFKKKMTVKKIGF